MLIIDLSANGQLQEMLMSTNYHIVYRKFVHDFFISEL